MPRPEGADLEHFKKCCFTAATGPDDHCVSSLADLLEVCWNDKAPGDLRGLQEASVEAIEERSFHGSLAANLALLEEWVTVHRQTMTL